MTDRETREYIINELNKLRDMICGIWGCDPAYFIGSDDAKEDKQARNDVKAMEGIWFAVQALIEANEEEDE